jgi:hypothetical protein
MQDKYVDLYWKTLANIIKLKVLKNICRFVKLPTLVTIKDISIYASKLTTYIIVILTK